MYASIRPDLVVRDLDQGFEEAKKKGVFAGPGLDGGRFTGEAPTSAWESLASD